MEYSVQSIYHPDSSLNQVLKDAADDLSLKGLSIQADFLSIDLVSQWNLWMTNKLSIGVFSDAGVGLGAVHQANPTIRRDKTLWLSPRSDDPVEQSIVQCIEHIRDELNRELFAGLIDYESHCAVYYPGGFYKKHVDTFRDDDARAITFIIYLNETWESGHGGKLRVYLESGEHIDIEPKAGTLVLFKSRDFPHEVLESSEERRSITGWYKVRSLHRLPEL
jgi:SM-20-related protein